MFEKQTKSLLNYFCCIVSCLCVRHFMTYYIHVGLTYGHFMFYYMMYFVRTSCSASSETQGQLVGAGNSLNGRKKIFARRKVKNAKKSPWGQGFNRFKHILSFTSKIRIQLFRERLCDKTVRDNAERHNG